MSQHTGNKVWSREILHRPLEWGPKSPYVFRALSSHGPVRREQVQPHPDPWVSVFLGEGPARRGTFQDRAKQEELWRARPGTSHAQLGSSSRDSHPLFFSSDLSSLLNECGLVGRQPAVRSASLRAIPEVVSLCALHRKV